MDINNLLNKIKQILTQPTDFFRKLWKETGVKSAFLYLAIIALFSSILGLIVGQLFQNFSYDLLSKMFGINLPRPEYTILMLVFLGLLGYAITLLGSFIIAGILHVWIMIFGGKQDYSKTYQLAVYSSTPRHIIGWIPIVGVFAFIYDLVLLIIGTQKIYNFSSVKSILMYVIPLAVFILIALVAMIFFMLFLKGNPTLFQDLASIK